MADRGRPKKPIDWKLFDALIVWASQEYCAEQLGVSVSHLEKTLKREKGVIFSEYKKKRMEPLRINLLKKQYDVAMNGNVSMLIWLGKQHLGQSDQAKIEEDRDLEFV